MKSNKPLIYFNKTKRPFLLIEILIAFSLITLFSIPLIRNPIYFYQSQIKSLEKIECERIADLTFLELKLKLYKNKININNISKKSQDALLNNLSPYKLDIFKNKKIKRSYMIYSKREKTSTDNKIYKLIFLKIFLQPQNQKKPYEYKYKLVLPKN